MPDRELRRMRRAKLVEIILALKQTVEVIDAITAKVESGEFPMEELDAKVYRVLRLKQSLGLLQ